MLVQAWAPFNNADKELLEKVQRRTVLMVSNIRGDYEDKMRTLEERRLRGDLIETYKILTGKSDVDPKTWFSLASDTDPAIRT